VVLSDPPTAVNPAIAATPIRAGDEAVFDCRDTFFVGDQLQKRLEHCVLLSGRVAPVKEWPGKAYEEVKRV
jgi:hypothetical protein